MLPHHEAWLSANTHRTEEWLRDRVKDGFDIHHMDGDHSNNDPDNLVLIEHVDHMRLHGMHNALGRMAPRRGGGRPKNDPGPLGRATYEMRLQTAFTWAEISDLTGAPGPKSAMNLAKAHARRDGLTWPCR